MSIHLNPSPAGAGCDTMVSSTCSCVNILSAFHCAKDKDVPLEGRHSCSVALPALCPCNLHGHMDIAVGPLLPHLQLHRTGNSSPPANAVAAPPAACSCMPAMDRTRTFQHITPTPTHGLGHTASRWLGTSPDGARLNPAA